LQNEREEEALELYLKEQNSFFVAFKLSTDNFEFHSDIVIPMLFKYKDNAFAYEESIRILEIEQILVEAAIIMNGGNDIPKHYGRLISELEQLYINIGCYDNALVLSDKILNITNQMDVKAIAYNNKAHIYRLMGNQTAAIKSAKRAISILTELEQQDNRIYSHCQEIIADIKGKPQKSNLFGMTYFFPKY